MTNYNLRYARAITCMYLAITYFVIKVFIAIKWFVSWKKPQVLCNL